MNAALNTLKDELLLAPSYERENGTEKQRRRASSADPCQADLRDPDHAAVARCWQYMSTEHDLILGNVSGFTESEECNHKILLAYQRYVKLYL